MRILYIFFPATDGSWQLSAVAQVFKELSQTCFSPRPAVQRGCTAIQGDGRLCLCFSNHGAGNLFPRSAQSPFEPRPLSLYLRRVPSRPRWPDLASRGSRGAGPGAAAAGAALPGRTAWPCRRSRAPRGAVGRQPGRPGVPLCSGPGRDWRVRSRPRPRRFPGGDGVGRAPSPGRRRPVSQRGCAVVLSPGAMQAPAPGDRTERHAVAGRARLPDTQLGRVSVHGGQPDHQRLQFDRKSRDGHLHPLGNLQRLGM